MKFLRVLFLMGTAAVGVAQTPVAQTNMLSLEDCIAIALEHNFDVQIVRYNPVLARFDLAGNYGSYEPTFSFSGDHDYNLSPGGIDDEGRTFAGNETESDFFSTGISGLLPWGTIYNLGANVTDRYGTRPGVIIDPSSPTVSTNSFVDINSGNTISVLETNFGTLAIRSPFETVSGSAAAVTLRQPLLRNFWIDNTRFQIYASKKSVKIEEEAFRLQLMNTITDVESAYFNLVSAEDSVVVQERALELAKRLLAENKKRVEVGALAPLDERQAESQVASSRASLLSAFSSRDTAERSLKNLLSDDYLKNWATIRITPTDRLLALPQEFNLQESWTKGLAQRPDLIAARLGLDISEMSIRLARNQLFPQLDVIGSYGYAGSSDNYSDTFDQIGKRDNPFWSVGGQFSIPLGQRSARYSLKSAKASKEIDQLRLKQQEQALLIGIEDAIGVARTSFERVQATREARRYAEAALDAEQKKLESGKSTSFVVLQLQSDLTSARANEISALADYNIALAVLAQREGSTFERRGVRLNVKTLDVDTVRSP
jgi:outer membrane protein